jgi:hypothetical protein
MFANNEFMTLSDFSRGTPQGVRKFGDPTGKSGLDTIVHYRSAVPGYRNTAGERRRV